MKRDFAIRPILSKAWDLTIHNLGFLIILMIVVGLINIAPSLANSLLQVIFGQKNIVGVLLGLVVVVISAVWLQPVVTAGMIQVYLNLIDGKPHSVGQLFSRKELWWRIFLAGLLYGFIMMVALLGVLILYGIMMAIFTLLRTPDYTLWISLILIPISAVLITYILTRYSYYAYFIVDKDATVTGSLRSSWHATKGIVLKLVLFSFVIIGINLLGVLALGLGLLVTIPMTVAASALLFREIAK